jgi:hypothetical protein
VLAVGAVELGFPGGDDERFDVVVVAEVVGAALLAGVDVRRRAQVRGVDAELLELRLVSS